MAQTMIVHLVRQANGLESFCQFLESYHRHPAGVKHELGLIFKGFRNPLQLWPYQELLRKIPYQSIKVHDRQLDLGPYVQAAQKFDAEYLFFCNSFSRILANNWLAHFMRHALRPEVGMLGATGSYESMNHGLGKYRPIAHPPFIRSFVPRWRREHRAWRASYGFDPFPNVHIRSNAFMMRRELLLSLQIGPLEKKHYCWRFESGKQSMTRQIQQRGLSVCVVGCDGRAYSPADWYASRTFRSSNQENLLVADNRTEDYQHATLAERAVLTRLAWGIDVDANRRMSA